MSLASSHDYTGAQPTKNQFWRQAALSHSNVLPWDFFFSNFSQSKTQACWALAHSWGVKCDTAGPPCTDKPQHKNHWKLFIVDHVVTKQCSALKAWVLVLPAPCSTQLNLTADHARLSQHPGAGYQRIPLSVLFSSGRYTILGRWLQRCAWQVYITLLISEKCKQLDSWEEKKAAENERWQDRVISWWYKKSEWRDDKKGERVFRPVGTDLDKRCMEVKALCVRN